MRTRVVVAILVDLVLGAFLVVIAVTHGTLVFREHDPRTGQLKSVGMHRDRLVTYVVIIMAVTTAWWLLGLRHKGKEGAGRLHS